MIERRIFTYWEGDWGEDESKCWGSILEHHPANLWKREIITPETIDEHIDGDFFFNFLKLKSQRADYIRTWEVFKRGGIWVDTDIFCLRTFEHLLDLPFIAGWENDEYVNNAVLGAEAGSPILLYVLAHIPNYAKFGRSATAPLLLTEAMREFDVLHMALPKEFFYPIHWTCKKKDVDYDQLNSRQYPNSFAIHRWQWIWKQYE